MGYSKTGVGADSHSSYNLPVSIIDTFISNDVVRPTKDYIDYFSDRFSIFRSVGKRQSL